MNNKTFTKEETDAILNDRLVRQETTSKSHFIFFHIFLNHYVKYQIAEFQKEIFQITEDVSNKLACIMAFRGSAKSTLITLSYTLWSILGVQQKKFVVIICQTQTQAKQHMANIKYELDNNIVLRSDMGPFREEVDKNEWAMSSLVFTNTGARIMVASIDQSIRGVRHHEHRPDVIILDDIEDVSSAKNYDGRQKVLNWFSREIVPLGDTNTRIIIMGNLVHEDSFMMHMKRKIDKGEIDGVFRSFPLLDNMGKCLWPQKFDSEDKIEKLKKDTMNDRAWMMEYLLRPISDDTQVILSEWIRYYEKIPEKNTANEYRGAFIGIDLAISEKETADYTAMVTIHVFGYGNNTKIYIDPNLVNQRLNFPAALKTTKRLSESYLYENRKAQVFCEDNGYFKSFIQVLEEEGVVQIEGVSSRCDKRTRLVLVSPWMKSGRVFFPNKGAEQLIAQITGFGVERHDDLMDAFSLIIGEVMKKSHPVGVPKVGTAGPKHDLRGPYIPFNPNQIF